MPILAARLISVLSLVFLAPMATSQVIGVTWPGDVVVFDPISGEGGVVGPSGFSMINSMAKDSSGRILASTKSSQPRLIEIDPQTFTGSIAYATYLNDVRGLDFAPGDDTLMYALDSSGGGTSNDLYTLDLTVPAGSSSIKTWVGSTNLSGIQALAFAPDGTLYAWSTGWGLLVLDPETAKAVNVSGANDGSSAIQSLFFDGAGELYGVHEDVYKIDRDTGARTLLSTGQFGSVRGAEFYAGLCASYNYCEGAPNSAGPGAHIQLSGSTSISANDMTLLATGGPPQRPGLFFYNASQTQLPFGDGFLCVGSGAPGTFRLNPPLVLDAAGSGSRAVDFGVAPANEGPGAIHPGSNWNFQFYYRDPAGPLGNGFNASDALNVTFCL